MEDGLWHEERLLIGGKLVEATGGATYENTNPATEAVIGTAADAGSPDVDAAVAAARQAFDESRHVRALYRRTTHSGSAACVSCRNS